MERESASQSRDRSSNVSAARFGQKITSRVEPLFISRLRSRAPRRVKPNRNHFRTEPPSTWDWRNSLSERADAKHHAHDRENADEEKRDGADERERSGEVAFAVDEPLRRHGRSFSSQSIHEHHVIDDPH